MSRVSRRCSVAVALWVACTAGACATIDGSRLYRSGTDALRAGDAAHAIVDLEAAVVLVPDASEIQNHLGLAYEAAGREGDALAAFRRAVALDCDNRPAGHNLLLAEEREERRLTGQP